MHIHHSFLSLSKGIPTIFRNSSLFGHCYQSNDALIRMIWQWRLLSKAMKSVNTVRGEKARSWEKRIPSMSYQAKHHWDSFEVWEGENFPGRNSLVCLHLVPTENKPSVYWHQVSLNSLRWTCFKRKLPIYFSLNCRRKVHANFSSLKHCQLLCFLNIYSNNA